MLKLVLGSVQFGLNYGISNLDLDRVAFDEVVHILKYAHAQGVQCVDTAASYGVSEAVLGDALLQAQLSDMQLITKIPPFFNASEISSVELLQVEKVFVESLAKLKRDSVYGLMVHHADDLLKPGGDQFWKLLLNFKAQGLVDKIGCSFYTREQIEVVYEQCALEIMQVPANIFDQRLFQDDFLSGFQVRGIEVYVRSVFLQGLIFLQPENLPEKLRVEARRCLSKFHELSKYYGLSAIELALAFFKDKADLNLVVGVTSLNELRDVVAALHKIEQLAIDPICFNDLASHDLVFLNPSLWGRA